MGLNRQFLVGFISCLFLVSCAGASFRYYGLSGVNYEEGMLRGPKEKDDLPFSSCTPTENEPSPCVVMFANEFFELKLDYEDTQQKLKECQKGH